MILCLIISERAYGVNFVVSFRHSVCAACSSHVLPVYVKGYLEIFAVLVCSKHCHLVVAGKRRVIVRYFIRRQSTVVNANFVNGAIWAAIVPLRRGEARADSKGVACV